MSGRPRILMRSRLRVLGSSRARKMEGRRKGNDPPRRPKIASATKSKPAKKRSQSPGPSKKSPLPRSPTKRRLRLSPKIGLATRKSKAGTRVAPKRSRASPSNRNTSRCGPESPSHLGSRPHSREPRGRSDRDLHSSLDRPRNRETSEKKYAEKSPPPERGLPVKEFRCDREDLKKLTMTICRNISGGSGSQIHRTIFHPEDIRIVRRPGSK